MGSGPCSHAQTQTQSLLHARYFHNYMWSGGPQIVIPSVLQYVLYHKKLHFQTKYNNGLISLANVLKQVLAEWS